MKQENLFFNILFFLLSGSLTYAQNIPDNIINIDCYVQPTPAQWGIKEVNINNNVLVHNYGSLTVGDIDGDGIVEIIGYKESDTDGTYEYDSPGLKIFYYNKVTNQIALKKEFLFSATGGASSSTMGAMAIARYNNTGYIVVPGIDKYLYAYNANGEQLWKSDQQYRSAVGYSTILGIADFNGDGIPEVYTGNQIFSLSNGKMLCDGGTTNASGVLVASTGSYTVAADMDNDGKPEIVAGTDIYKVTITNNNGMSGNSIDLISDMQLKATLPQFASKDGATQVVDIDNDGQLEVVVTSLEGGMAVVYVWKPVAGGQSYIMGSYLVSGIGYYSIPMIGNIDSTIYPEIVFIANNYFMYALKYDPEAAIGNQISEKWKLTHTDYSGCTGATLFDFNQDGRNEIVYRDETSLRIIDGSNDPSLDPGDTKATFNNVISATLREFPIIADIDGDGQAEIVVTGHDGGAKTIDGIAASYQNGYLRVFKAGSSTWAPARKVWNQYAYNAVNVNEDLTIPEIQLNMATLFPGYDGLFGTGDDVRPFNGFLQQQTILSQDGVPLWLAPKAEIIGTPTFSYDDDVSHKMTITIQIKNAGNAAFQSPFHVTVSKNIAGGSPNITFTYPNIIGIGETITMTLEIDNFNTWHPHKTIIIKANDSGDGQNEQEVCSDSQSFYYYYGIFPTQQDVCAGKVKQMTCSFTLGATDSYQWQSSKDNHTWTDISGATAVSYTPANQKRGITYYRVVVNNNNASNPEIINSESVRLRVRSCQLPVNHNISVMGYYD